MYNSRNYCKANTPRLRSSRSCFRVYHPSHKPSSPHVRHHRLAVILITASLFKNSFVTQMCIPTLSASLAWFKKKLCLLIISYSIKFFLYPCHFLILFSAEESGPFETVEFPTDWILLIAYSCYNPRFSSVLWISANRQLDSETRSASSSKW